MKALPHFPRARQSSFTNGISQVGTRAHASSLDRFGRLLSVVDRFLWKRNLGYAAPVLVWVAVIVIGMGRILAYSVAPGTSGSALSQWPHESKLAREEGISTLVVFVHPRCPCSKATLVELEKILPAKALVHVVFTRPAQTDEGWTQTETWRAAMALPGVRVSTDKDGIEARRFGAETSGQVALYDASGHLSFFGGITGARGHAGDNSGRQALIAALAAHDVGHTPVYGCPLEDK
jgi:hypothetical protein